MNVLHSKRMVGKVALVTGAASGIGKTTARRLADEGARVALADVNEPELAKVADAICAAGNQAVAIRLDVTVEADWQAALARILSQWGRLDISVNCAGISLAKPIHELSLADWRRIMATNLDSVFLGTRQAMSTMKAGDGGCIVNIASAAGIKAISGNAAYGTSKAAIRFFTGVAALEGKPHGIRVNSISPGAVATPMWASTDMWPKQAAETGGREAALKALVTDQGFAEPEEIAAAVLFLASDDARHVTGVDLPVDDGFAITSVVNARRRCAVSGQGRPTSLSLR
jgi:3(or 17)beta-hydroxysteroid dehydrogenase